MWKLSSSVYTTSNALFSLLFTVGRISMMLFFFLCFNRTAKIYARDFVPGQARLVFLEAEASGKYI